MDEQRQDDQLEPTYSSSSSIRDVVLRTCWRQWTIGRDGERGSGISVLIVRHDDDDDESKFIFYANNCYDMHAYGIKIYNEINLFKSHVKIEIIFYQIIYKKDLF